ncbi:copper transport protein ctr1 [Cymbomonas tetramitiformis]|uniref:Copper transport protein ctr1 n=1 Tax=Cymbomonas tetramitiformis TaxID=36881 RepID=A0AAE0EWR4_9CHLO|nr:copper transport protein ctr1 [Cymbomonas tetramitiformis]
MPAWEQNYCSAYQHASGCRLRKSAISTNNCLPYERMKFLWFSLFLTLRLQHSFGPSTCRAHQATRRYLQASPPPPHHQRWTLYSCHMCFPSLPAVFFPNTIDNCTDVCESATEEFYLYAEGHPLTFASTNLNACLIRIVLLHSLAPANPGAPPRSPPAPWTLPLAPRPPPWRKLPPFPPVTPAAGSEEPPGPQPQPPRPSWPPRQRRIYVSPPPSTEPSSKEDPVILMAIAVAGIAGVMAVMALVYRMRRQGVCSGKEAPAEKPTGRPPGAGRRDGWFPSEGCMGEGRPRHFCDNAQHASTAGSWSRGVDDAVPRASGHSAPQAPGQWATLSSQASSAKWGRQERGGKAPLGRGSSRPKRAPAPLPRDPEAGEQPCSFEGGPPHDVDSLRQDIGRSLDLKLKGLDAASFMRALSIETPNSANEVDLKRAFRRAALNFHPDRNKGKGLHERIYAEEVFKRITQLMNN